MKLVYLFGGVLGLLIHFAHSVNPGIGLKLNERGFEAVGRYTKQLIEKNFKKFPIPNFESKSYHITNLKLLQLNPGQISLQSQSPNAIALSTTEFSVTATCNWAASIGYFGALKGKARVTLGGVSLSQKVLLGKARNEAPEFSVGPCSASVGSLTVTVSNVGWIQFIVQSIVSSESVVNFIKNKISSKICPEINNKLEKYFHFAQVNYPVNFSIDDYVTDLNNLNINIGLTQPPQVTNSSVALLFSGRCYNSADNPNQQFSFLAPPVPAFRDTNQMAQAMLSQYVLNTFLYSLWENNHYSMVYTEEQISSVIGVDVDAHLLAQRIPEFNDYLNKPLQFALTSPETFRVQITGSGVSVSGEISAQINAIGPNKAVETVIENTVRIQVEADLWIKKNAFHWNITHLSVRPITSGPSADAFQHFFETYGLPIIRQYSHNKETDGILLPVFYGFRITQPSINFDQNVVVVGGSIEQV